jgi:GNAT superfamily N-acetyltransferase
MSAGPTGAAPSPSVEDVAREVIGWLRTGPDVDRADLGECVLVNRRLPHLWFASATRVRFDPAGVVDAIARVRAWFHDRGRAEFVWVLGPDHAPGDLVERLVAGGARREPGILTAMVLDHEPPAGPPGIEVRPVATFDEFVLGEEILAAGFGFSEADVAAEREAYGRSWAHWQTEPDRLFLLAWHDGRPIAEAGMAPTSAGPFVLSGGATLPEARGLGAYRALVRARWDEAARRGTPAPRGTPALVVQASPMSRPILERSGFRAVGEITLLIDRSSPPG